MKPLQFFRSTVNCPPNERDMKRALEAWWGQHTIWLLPGITKAYYWQEKTWNLVALPAEHLDRIDVYHVGSNGYVYGIDSDKYFPKSRLDGLLEAWLNCKEVELFQAPQTLEIEVPEFTSDGVTYRRVDLPVRPKGMLPIESVDESGEFVARWSPDFKTVSPDAESDERYGPFQPGTLDGLTIGRSLKDGTSSFFCVASWPPPVGSLIPQSAGADLIRAQQTMKEISAIGSTDPILAIQKAKDEAGIYISEGHTSFELGWYWPTFLGNGPDAVRFGVEDFRIRPANMEALSRDGQFRQKMATRMDVSRAVGPGGLFWSLLIESLSSFQRYASCKQCGWLIQGRRGKMYCGPQDNAECHRARQAKRQRKSRNQQLSGLRT